MRASAWLRPAASMLHCSPAPACVPRGRQVNERRKRSPVTVASHMPSLWPTPELEAVGLIPSSGAGSHRGRKGICKYVSEDSKSLLHPASWNSSQTYVLVGECPWSHFSPGTCADRFHSPGHPQRVMTVRAEVSRKLCEDNQVLVLPSTEPKQGPRESSVS